MADRKMSKSDLETLAQFRYQLRRFLRFSEEVTHRDGLTPLQYLLLLQIGGFPDRDWATVAELAERLQAKHHGVVALVSRCEEAGLVRRITGRDDRRRVEVHLTRKGSRRLDLLAGLHHDELKSLRAGLLVPGFAHEATKEDARGGTRDLGRRADEGADT
jgi:DNA-binding MarR family transcriptional regulator